MSDNHEKILKTALTKDGNPYFKWQVKIFIATWLSYAGYYFCRKAYFVVKAYIGESFGITTIDLAYLGSAYFVFYMIGQFSSGFFGKKLGPKLLLLTGMGISIICNFIFGISNSFWTFMLFISLNGLVQGTGWPGCIGSLAFWYRRRKRGYILGIWSTCYQIGSVIATSFAAFMLGYAGWRWSFFGAAIVLLIIWAVVLMLHPNRPEDVDLPIIKEDHEESEKLVSDGLKMKGWTRNVVISIIMMGSIYFCIKFSRYALWSWSPFFLKGNFNMAGDDAGYLSTVFDIAGFVGVVFAGFLSDRFFKGRRAFLSFAMLIFMTVSFILMYKLGSESVLYFTISMGCAGFMLYGPDSLLSGVGAIDVGLKENALATAGIINGIGSIGPIFQEQIIGWMYEYYNHDLAPILFMLLTVASIGTVIAFFLWRRARRGKSRL